MKISSESTCRARSRALRQIVQSPFVVLILLIGIYAYGARIAPAVIARPTTFYVSPSGSDGNAGTFEEPWRTLRYAVSQLTAGDTLYLRGGVYSSRADTVDSQTGVVPSGTSWDNAVTIAGYPGEQAIVQPPDGGAGLRITWGAPHYLIFQDFTVDMSRQSDYLGALSAFYLSDGSHHIRLQRMDLGSTRGDAVQLSYNNHGAPAASFVEILNSRIHHAGQYSGDSGHGGYGINNGYGIYMYTTDNLVDGNEFDNNCAFAIVAYGDRNVFRYNKIHDNGTHGGVNAGINIGSSSYPLISSDNVIHDNTIYNNRGGIQVYTNADSTQVYNNTVYNNYPGDGILIQWASGSVISNNTLFSNGGGIVDLGWSTTINP
jgi:parallel beta-helix repeat protein